MTSKLRVLILEDIPTDAALMEDALAEAEFSLVTKCVSTKVAFTKAVEEFSPEIILSDYSLPSFDGFSALKIALDKCPSVPFIFVSGALGEEMAIDLLKKGATDYVLKNRMTRLAPAVSRALLEVKERTERLRAEEALKDSEVRYRTIFENTGTATVIIDQETTILLANKEFERMAGQPISDIEGKMSWKSFVHKDDMIRVNSLIPLRQKKFKMPPNGFELRIVNRDGGILYVLANITAIPSTNMAVMSLLDITERKSAEEALRMQEQELRTKSQSLEEANTALKVLLKHREEDKATMEEQVLTNIKNLVLPDIANLKNLKLNDHQKILLENIERHLHEIVSPFLRNLTSTYISLTPREIQIANLVKEGKTTKEMTELLNISSTAVDFHRKNIRFKFGIKNTQTNLRSYLLSLSS